MSKKLGNVLNIGQALSYPISENRHVILDDGIVVIDVLTKEIYVGDGVTPGGNLPSEAIWKVTSLDEMDNLVHMVGDYILVGGEVYHRVTNSGIVPLELLATEEYGNLDGWTTLELYTGWSISQDAVGDARVRKDGNLVTIDAVLKKDKSSDWSPFRLPTWARPNKTVYQTIEVNTSRGADPLVIYPDGYLYPRKIYTKKVSRVSIQITFWIDTV